MEKSFRSAMFGFNREDVAKYIYQQSKSFESKLADKNVALEESNAALTEAQRKLKDLDESVERIKEISALLDDFRTAYGDLSSAIREEAASFDAVESGYGSLEEKCDKLMAFQEKANKFDSLATALSGIFGGGIKPESGDQNVVDAASDDVSPIHQAKVSVDQTNKKLEALGEVFEKIGAAVESLKA